MDYSLADRVSRIKPSATLAITARANQIRAEGGNILSLAAGEPDFDTPEHIKEAAIAAMRAGKTKYTAVAGTASLKDAVIGKFRRDNRLEYTANEVMVSTGAKQVLYNLCQALLNDGDEVLIPAPYWVSYPDIVLLAGGKPVIIAGRAENRSKITAEDLERSITDKTRLLVLNSPSNPTGIAYTRDELGALGGVLERHPQVFVISDDIYEHIMFRGQEFSNILNATPSLADRTLVLNGVSKVYSMTGWRIGYVGGPEAVIKSMTKIQSQSTSNPSSISQAAAEAALTGDQGFVATMRDAFEERHNFIVGALNEIDGIHCPLSDGTFYCFPNIDGLIERTQDVTDDVGFVEHLLNQAGLAMVPGTAFGSPGYMRISYATSMEVLKEAATRLKGI
ncbi:MAG: pyridoxal phosphate-dependent aminotransferase [Gammaproteobacteria bacterium]|nr:pyridoxal phosphate-dependent aminotransferase [Gammaproteobacteria bacterium]